MSTLLVVTVGENHNPIVTAISQLNPQRVIYICSGKGAQQTKGSNSTVIGTSCSKEQEVPGMLQQLSLLGINIPFNEMTDLICLPNPDRFMDCYQQIRQVIQNNLKLSQQVIADYTGGTKTMSAALVAAALELGIELSITTGARVDLTRVTASQQRMVATDSLKLSRAFQQGNHYLAQFNYPAITTLLMPLSELNLNNDERCKLQQLTALAAALNEWDKFNHLSAIDLLSNQVKPVVSEVHTQQLREPFRHCTSQQTCQLLKSG